MTVYTDRGAIPTPQLDEPPHGPDQMAALADRVAAILNAPRFTETERDAIGGDDLYDGRLVMIVDSGGAFVRVDVYHADDPADPAAGGTWQTVSDATAYVPKAGGTFDDTVTIDGGGIHPTLGDDFASPNDPPSAYPPGYSMFRDLAGVWPAGGSGIVETINGVGGQNAWQRSWETANTVLYQRVAIDSSTWSSWFTNNDYLARDGSNSPTATIDWAGQALINVTFDDYSEDETQIHVDANGVATIDFTDPVQRISGSELGDLTEFAYSNITGGDQWQSVLLWLQSAVSNSVTWPASTGFEGGDAPDLSQGQNFLVLIARDPNRVAVFQSFANLVGGSW
jgi:hypothetical protein